MGVQFGPWATLEEDKKSLMNFISKIELEKMSRYGWRPRQLLLSRHQKKILEGWKPGAIWRSEKDTGIQWDQ